MDLPFKANRSFTDGIWVKEDGDRVDGPPENPDGYSYFLIARDQNENYMAALSASRRRMRNSKNNDIDLRKAIETMCRVMAADILLDWRFVRDMDTREYMEATQPNRHSVLMLSPTFREWVQKIAADEGLFADQQAREQGKGSVATSHGDATGSPETMQA